MRKLAIGGAALAAVGAAVAAVALQNESAPPPVSIEAPDEEPAAVSNATEGEAAPAPAAPRRAAPVPRSEQATPMAERVATIGLLNKRNGLWRDLKMKPGQAVRVGDVIVRLRACDKTAPWEQQVMTGAFVQVDVKGADEKWRRVFSGWLFKESPSLNVVEHPIYDVWAKDCAMKHPEIGPGTTVLSAPKASGAPTRSSAPKSAEGPAATAQSSNDT